MRVGGLPSLKAGTSTTLLGVRRRQLVWQSGGLPAPNKYNYLYDSSVTVATAVGLRGRAATQQGGTRYGTRLCWLFYKSRFGNIVVDQYQYSRYQISACEVQRTAGIPAVILSANASFASSGNTQYQYSLLAHSVRAEC